MALILWFVDQLKYMGFPSLAVSLGGRLIFLSCGFTGEEGDT